MTQNLLDDDNADDNFVVDPNANYLEQLVGENKKFKTVDDLAKGKAQSDHYISTLERRLDAISSDYRKVLDERNAMPKLQELLDKIEQQQNLQSRETNPDSNGDQNRSATLSSEQLESLVSNKYAQFRQTEKETENYRNVQTKLSEKFGNNYKTILREQADALGLSDDEVNQMARKNPNLFYKTFDLTGSKDSSSFTTPPKSEIRNNNFVPKQNKRTLSYYEKLRKENPRLYLDPKIGVQMDKDAQELGDAFFDV